MANETRNSNGQLGEGTPAKRLKSRFAKESKGVSLKTFARALMKGGDKDATDWFASKCGALNLSKSDKTKGRIAAEKASTKLSRTKKK